MEITERISKLRQECIDATRVLARLSSISRLYDNALQYRDGLIDAYVLVSARDAEEVYEDIAEAAIAEIEAAIMTLREA